MVSEQKATPSERLIDALQKSRDAWVRYGMETDPEMEVPFAHRNLLAEIDAALEAAISQPAEAVETDLVPNSPAYWFVQLRSRASEDGSIPREAIPQIARMISLACRASPATDAGEPEIKANADLVKALDWAYPLAAQYQAYWAGERAKAGHTGLGTKWSTLYDSEVADQEFALAALTEAKAALVAASAKERPCTCHPDDNPPSPCAERYALSDCRRTSKAEG